MSSNSEFYHAIQGILKSWTALQLAVSHGFGGVHSSEKAQWMVGVIENYFAENDSLELWELEDFLAQIMSEEFDTMLEDDSLSLVCREIFEVFNLWSQNKLPELRKKLQSLPQVNLADCISENQELDEPMPALPEQAEFSSLSIAAGGACSSNDSTTKPPESDDGWTMVTRSRAKRRS